MALGMVHPFMRMPEHGPSGLQFEVSAEGRIDIHRSIIKRTPTTHIRTTFAQGQGTKNLMKEE